MSEFQICTDDGIIDTNIPLDSGEASVNISRVPDGMGPDEPDTLGLCFEKGDPDVVEGPNHWESFASSLTREEWEMFKAAGDAVWAQLMP